MNAEATRKKCSHSFMFKDKLRLVGCMCGILQNSVVVHSGGLVTRLGMAQFIIQDAKLIKEKNLVGF